jgi:hypothetical protein
MPAPARRRRRRHAARALPRKPIAAPPLPEPDSSASASHKDCRPATSTPCRAVRVLGSAAWRRSTVGHAPLLSRAEVLAHWLSPRRRGRWSGPRRCWDSVSSMKQVPAQLTQQFGTSPRREASQFAHSSRQIPGEDLRDWVPRVSCGRRPSPDPLHSPSKPGASALTARNATMRRHYLIKTAISPRPPRPRRAAPDRQRTRSQKSPSPPRWNARRVPSGRMPARDRRNT